MIVFRNPSPIEVSEGNGQIILEIDPIASEITTPAEVAIFTTNGSAVSTVFNDGTAGVDFSPIDNPSITIDPDNPDSLSFAIDLTDDAIAEPDENFQFQVTSSVEENLNGVADIIIVDNDRDDIIIDEPEPDLLVEELLPQISIASVEQLEGDGGNTDFEFVVNLSEPSTEAIAVDYTTADGTAEAKARLENNQTVDLADYVPLNGTLEFEPGATERSIMVEVLADTLPLNAEAAEETFFVNLANAVNAEIEVVLGTGTILDDDLDDTDDATDSLLPFLSLEDKTFIEGDEGDTVAELRVNLVDANNEPVVAEEDLTFSYSTTDINAAADIDYEFISSQTATIPQGKSGVNIPITIIGDAIIEADEIFLVTLADRETEITILDDDSVGELEIEDFRANDVFRFLNSDTGGYLYTASEIEQDFVAQNLDNYTLEQSSFASVNPDAEEAEEIYRFYNPSTGGYFYTASEIERDAILNNLDEFVFENIGFYVFDTAIENTVPVYRFFETNNGIHFYTANENERAFVRDNLPNYNFEGIAFYALPAESNVF